MNLRVNMESEGTCKYVKQYDDASNRNKNIWPDTLGTNDLQILSMFMNIINI